ncbi:hypothetical protein nvc1_142 [Namao virus]|nr:hypothetical protein nvc1_142 [Namao virus]
MSDPPPKKRFCHANTNNMDEFQRFLKTQMTGSAEKPLAFCDTLLTDWKMSEIGDMVLLMRETKNYSTTVRFEIETSTLSKLSCETESFALERFWVHIQSMSSRRWLTLSCVCGGPQLLPSGGLGYEVKSVRCHAEGNDCNSESDRDSVYYIDDFSREWSLYKYIEMFLYQQGVTPSFVCKLCDVSAGVSRERYIRFLRDLQGFLGARNK